MPWAWHSSALACLVCIVGWSKIISWKYNNPPWKITEIIWNTLGYSSRNIFIRLLNVIPWLRLIENVVFKKCLVQFISRNLKVWLKIARIIVLSGGFKRNEKTGRKCPPLTPPTLPPSLSNPPYLTLCCRERGGPKMFDSKYFSDSNPQFFWTHNIFGPKMFLDPTFFWT